MSLVFLFDVRRSNTEYSRAEDRNATSNCPHAMTAVGILRIALSVSENDMTGNGLGKARVVAARKGNLNGASANNQGRVSNRPERTEPKDVEASHIENRVTGTKRGLIGRIILRCKIARFFICMITKTIEAGALSVERNSEDPIRYL